MTSESILAELLAVDEAVDRHAHDAAAEAVRALLAVDVAMGACGRAHDDDRHVRSILAELLHTDRTMDGHDGNDDDDRVDPYAARARPPPVRVHDDTSLPAAVAVLWRMDEFVDGIKADHASEIVRELWEVDQEVDAALWRVDPVHVALQDLLEVDRLFGGRTPYVPKPQDPYLHMLAVDREIDGVGSAHPQQYDTVLQELYAVDQHVDRHKQRRRRHPVVHNNTNTGKVRGRPRSSIVSKMAKGRRSVVKRMSKSTALFRSKKRGKNTTRHDLDTTTVTTTDYGDDDFMARCVQPLLDVDNFMTKRDDDFRGSSDAFCRDVLQELRNVDFWMETRSVVVAPTTATAVITTQPPPRPPPKKRSIFSKKAKEMARKHSSGYLADDTGEYVYYKDVNAGPHGRK